MKTPTLQLKPAFKQSPKVYIGDIEALEIAFERRIFELPKKGRLIVTIPSLLEAEETGAEALILGKDEKGFYTAEVI